MGTLLESLNNRQKRRSGARAGQKHQWLTGMHLREESRRSTIDCKQIDVNGALALIDQALGDLVVFH